MRNLSYFSALFISLPTLWNLQDHKSNGLEITPGCALKQAFKIRGQREECSAANNSTIPTFNEVALSLGLRPRLDAPNIVWKLAWELQKKILPILHLRDPIKPKNLNICLSCLWWKALSGSAAKYPLYDDMLSYDMLPRFSRILVGRKLGRLFPRLHHGNVELRTAFIDRAISTEVEVAINSNETKRSKVRLISFGAGYDVRSIKFCSTNVIDEAYELDRPEVVEAKQQMMERLLLRRQHVEEPRSIALKREHLPKLIGLDLNDKKIVRVVLQDILSIKSTDNADSSWHTIFLFEGVMIHLDKGIPPELLRICSSVLQNQQIRDISSSGSLVFADRLESIPGGDIDAARKELRKAGWRIQQWCPNPGKARHMGTARQLKTFADVNDT